MNTETDEQNNAKKEQHAVKRWFAELDDAKKRDKNFHREGKRINGIYSSEEGNKVPFNILYSNTDTLLPALYSSVPRPVVQRRFKDDDPIAKAAAHAGTRLLEFILDTNIDGYETVNEGLQNAVIDALLPGRGVTRIKYDAEIGEYLEGEDAEVESEDDDQAEDAKETRLRKESELVCVDSISWDKVLFGYARKWSSVPWLAFEEVIDKEEAIRLFGQDMADKIKFTKGDDQDDEEQKDDGDDDQGERKTATIYQIWDKDGGRKVRYVSKHYKDGFLKVDDDPLELTGFYPVPKPLVLLAKSNDMSITAPYLIYENQAQEINELTIRIKKIVKAIKAKGLYDQELGADLDTLLGDDDLMFSPADKSATLADGGFEKSIWFMPVEQLVVVLRELVASREQCKQVIYEVTGISDIIRGSTVASETASAQQLKSQWGTMRLKRNQAEVQRYARDLLRIILEVAATKFSEEAWVKMTGLPYASSQQLAEAQAVMQAAQILPQDPQNPSPLIQQAQQVLQQPKWPEVLELLKNDMHRAYRIDIETNSTIAPEAVEDQKNMAEVMTALSQYLQGVTPLIESGSFPFEAAKAMMLATVRRFQFGSEIEDYIKNMQPPKPPDPPQDNSLQVKQAELQAKAQSEQATAQADIQKAQANNQLEAQKLEAQRIVEEGRASTQIHIEQLRIDAERELEMMRVASAEKIATFQANLDATTRLEIARISAEANIHQFNNQSEAM